MSVPFSSNGVDIKTSHLNSRNGGLVDTGIDGGSFGATNVLFDHQFASSVDQLNSRDSSLYLMNQKLLQLSLANCDLNGNDHASSFSSTNTDFSNVLSGNFENRNNFTVPPNGMNLDYALSCLRNKLVAIKQMQNDTQVNYKDAQTQFSNFAQHCRHQLNVILHEMSDDLDCVFKARLTELDNRENQIEEVLFRIDQRQQKLSLDNKNGNNFVSSSDEVIGGSTFFDSELSTSVKNVIDSQISGADIRLPNVDPAQIDRLLRSLLIFLIKQPTSSSSVFEASPSYSSLFNNDNEHFVPDSISNEPSVVPGVPISTWHTISRKCPKAAVSSTNSEFNVTVGNQQTEDNAIVSYYNQPNNGTSSYNDFQPPKHQQQTIPKSLQPKIRRERIIYYLKFGEQGNMDGQFAEPSGVAVNAANDDIFIADANNHRIQVFDKWGKFKFHFGEGKLKFPNRVAISRNTGDIVVSERPPVHQIQIYNKNGNFMCKFGSKHLRHPRGLAVDHKNRVIVVECKVMRVFIFNLRGDLLHSFDCSPQIQFPNAVAVSKDEEIFISDNRNHCVKVFSFSGEFLRQIGGQGTTNYPIGVCLNESTGHLLVVDNYNNLNVTIFRTDGQMIGAYESLVKHKQCLDVALFGDNSIVVTSKDLQVYIYRLKDMLNGNNSTNSNTNYSNNTNNQNNNNNRRHFHYQKNSTHSSNNH